MFQLVSQHFLARIRRIPAPILGMALMMAASALNTGMVSVAKELVTEMSPFE